MAVLIQSIFFLTNRNRNSITSTTNITCLSKIFLSAGFSVFVCKEYLSHLCCVKAVSDDYKHTRLYFLPTCIHICSYVNLRCSSSRLFFQVAFVFNRIKNPTSRTLYFSMVFNSKHKISRLRWLKAVSSTFQDVYFDVSLLPLVIT